ncbi:MAG: condensation domain-containing protein, partial [Stackebrandtia sp.]
MDGRAERALAALVGRFDNTLVLRSRVEPTRTFTELLDATRETDTSAFAHAEIPFERVAEVVAPDRAPVSDPLFGVVLSPRIDEPVVVNLPGLRVRGLGLGVPVAHFDLRIAVDPGRDSGDEPGELRVALTYATDLFDEETVRSIGRRLERILTAVAANPRVRVGEMEIDDPEPNRMVPLVADRPVPDATAGTALSQALGVSVEDDPDGPALAQGEQEVTYRELDGRSSRLARVLIARGCGPGSGVVSTLERGVDSVVATWAVLKAGATLVSAAAVESAVSAGLVVETGLAAQRAPELSGVKWVVLDDPAVADEIATASPRPVTYAHRVRQLPGGDLVVVDAAGNRTDYDQLAAAVTRAHAATDLTYESRTFRHGRDDGPAAVLE